MKTGALIRLSCAAGLALCAALPAFAGGPLGVCSGIPLKYPGAGTVTLNYDQGTLGPGRSKAQADALVTEAVALWTNVPTATVSLARGADLPVDVTAANYLVYIDSPGTSADGINPIIYDTDGTIIDAEFGVGARNQVLGYAGSGWNIIGGNCNYTEGRAVMSGFINVSDTTMKVVLAHEVGHLIGLDHSQLDNHQGLASSNYPLMYPIANRQLVSLHEDDAAAVSALYPDVTLNGTYGQLTGNFLQANGVTPIRGANIWVTGGANKIFSIVSDYLSQNNGYFKLLLPPGTYTLRAEAIHTNFTGGSSVGPYSELSTDPSFQAPLYVSGVAMAPLTLGNGTPTQIVISAGCAATAVFRFDGTGSVGGNCGVTVPGPPVINSVSRGAGSATIHFTAPASNGGSAITGYTATCSASGQTTRTNAGTSSPITVFTLKGGVAYTCSVAAINATGSSASSSTLAVTPAFNLAPMLMLFTD
ncbi:hypothetical protein BH11PSE11_BH11PSE11_38280 [soil metagenome]